MERGKILRDTSAGDGIIFINDGQKPFSLERNWRSGVPPKTGMVVEVTLDAAGNVDTITQIDEAQLAKEQAQKALGILSEQGRQGANALVARVGMPTLAAIGLLLVGWLFLNTISVRITASHSEGASFYDLLKVMNTAGNLTTIGGVGSASAGGYGFLMWICLLLPLAVHLYPNRYLALGYCAPLVYMAGCGIAAWLELKRSLSEASGMAGFFGGNQGRAMAEQMLNEMLSRTMAAISFGLGFYLATLAAAYLAFVGIRKFLASGAHV